MCYVFRLTAVQGQKAGGLTGGEKRAYGELAVLASRCYHGRGDEVYIRCHIKS